MKAYVATTYSNRHRQREIVAVLAQYGIEQTYDWAASGIGLMMPGDIEQGRELEKLEEQGVRDADVLILILPSAKGSQTELGIAIGLRKPIIILVDDEKDLISEDGRICVFHHRLENRIVYTVQSLMHEVGRIEKVIYKCGNDPCVPSAHAGWQPK